VDTIKPLKYEGIVFVNRVPIFPSPCLNAFSKLKFSRKFAIPLNAFSILIPNFLSPFLMGA
jgi:hypothetical protein